MTTHFDGDDLIDRYFNSELTDAEFDALQRLLIADPSAAEHFARRSRLESGLADYFRVQHAAEKVENVANTSIANTRRNRWFTVSAAALLALCVGSFWYVASRMEPGIAQPEAPPDSPMRGGARVLSGRIDANGVQVSYVAEGIEIQCVESAVLELQDQSRVTLQEQAQIVLPKRQIAERQLVELLRGTARFEVSTVPGTFVVRTPLGDIKDMGSEFSVELRPLEGHEKKGMENMKLSTALVVMVAAGLVEVNFGGVSYNLAGGQSRVFAEEKKTKVFTHTVSGSIESVDADAVTLSAKDKGGVHTESIKIGANTKIFIESNEDEAVTTPGKTGTRPKLVEAALDSLKPGERTRATVFDSGVAEQIVQLRHIEGKKKGDGVKDDGAFKKKADGIKDGGAIKKKGEGVKDEGTFKKKGDVDTKEF